MDFLVPFVAFALLGGVAIAVVLRWVETQDRAWLARTLVLAFALRLAMATLFALVPASRVFHEDATGCEGIAMNIAGGWLGEGPSFHYQGDKNYGFYYLGAGIYYLLGRYQPAISYFNAMIGTLTVFLIYRLTRSFFHRIVARRASLLVAVFPSMILWSSIAIKDALMAFLIVIALSSCVKLKRRLSFWSLLGTVLPIAAIQPIRFYMVYFVGFAIFASLLFERGLGAVSGVYKQLIVGGLVVGLLALAGLSGGARDGAEFLSLEKASGFRHGMATTANSGFAADADVSTTGGALAFLPIGISVLLFSPFPWQFTSMRALFAAPEMIVWWSLVPATVRGIRFAMKEKLGETSPLLLFSLTLTCAYSLVHGNVGSGFRQRAQIFVFLFIFAALGLYQKKCRRAKLDERLLLNERPPMLSKEERSEAA